MSEPKNCVLWRNPKSVVGAPLRASFELLETFVKDDHWWRYLLKCRECGQLYAFEFLEEIDWVNSDDPQYSTWVPVETEEEIERLRSAGQLDFRMFPPYLCKDWPKGGKQKIYWVTDEE
jgi:hypothetical protein